jgi:hypothetical protein
MWNGFDFVLKQHRNKEILDRDGGIPQYGAMPMLRQQPNRIDSKPSNRPALSAFADSNPSAIKKKNSYWLEKGTI